MGRTALLLVLGLGAAMGYIGLQMYRSGEMATATQYAYYKYMNSRNLARTSVHAALRTKDRGKALQLNTATSFNNGSFQVTDTSSNKDTLWFGVKGTYADSTYTMKIKLLQVTKPFPTVRAALGIRATPIDSFVVSGHPSVDGRAYNTDGTALLGSGDLPGIACMGATDTMKVHNNAGAANINGNPPIAIDPNTVDPTPFLDLYRDAAAPNIFIGPQILNTDFGTAAAPVVVYCDSGPNPDDVIQFNGGGNSYGILVIRGNLKFGGNCAWNGLVLIDGMNSEVQLSESGNPSIIGGCIVSGNAGAKVKIKGTATQGKIRYSPGSLERASHINKLTYYTILDWFE